MVSDFCILCEYLYSTTFTVCSDNNPLTYILTTVKLDVTCHQWVAKLATYNFNIRYKTGKTTVKADDISRINWNHEIHMDTVKSMFNTAMEGTGTFAEVYTHSVLACSTLVHYDPHPKQMTVDDWAKAQSENPDIQEVIQLYQNRSLDTAKLSRNKSMELRTLKRWQLQLKLRQNILYLKTEPIWEDRNDISASQEILETGPAGMPWWPWASWSGKNGWPFMGLLLITEYAGWCWEACDAVWALLKFQSKAAVRGILSHPHHLPTGVNPHILPYNWESKQGQKCECTDHITHYVQAIVTHLQAMKVTAKALQNNFIVHHDLPTSLVSDWRRNFESELIHQLFDLAQVKKFRTTQYHPDGSQCERFNSTLISMIGTLEAKDKSIGRTLS